jgi:class 3 adenylate cyclase/TolB-like protein
MRGDDLKRLMEARREIDRALMEQHAQRMAVLFTDIVGSTAFFEARGDIEGLARVHRHNDILFPIVEEHGGRVVKTIGDAIMAVFEDPSAAVGCGASMQRALQNLERDEDDPIRIRIGAHAGRVLVDGDDVFGDTVNVAARVAGAADGGEVLLSRSLFDDLPEDTPHRARSKGALPFKGKSEPLPVVALDWSGDAFLGRRGGSSDAPELFVLEMTVAGDALRVAAIDGAKDKGTVKAFSEQKVATGELEEIAGSVGALAHQGGESAYLDELRKRGEEMFERALSDRARRRLCETELQYLRMQLDDRLVQMPWELMYDGEGFLGLRFAMGRLVMAEADEPPPRRAVAHGGPMLIVSNPSGDLPAASREGSAVAALLEDVGAADVRHIDGPLPRERFLEELRGARLLHFAGHTDVDEESGDGGFRLQDGVAGAGAIAEAIAGEPPELVFANSCRASAGRGWRESARGTGGLASALLMRGVEHYLAPTWEIADSDALVFALRFYENALYGVPYGEATRRAREALLNTGKQPLSFAGYVLYGEPRTALAGARPRRPQTSVRSGEGAAVVDVEDKPEPARSTPRVSPRRDDNPTEHIRHPGPHVTHPPAARPSGGPMPLVVGLFLLVAFVGGGLFFLFGDSSADPPPEAAPTPSGPPPEAAARPTAPTEAEAKPPSPARHDGPVRISVLPFKNATGDAELDFLSDGLAEVVVTDFGQLEGMQLIERGQIEVDIGEIEFSQTKYVDPATRAALGKIAGAEVVVLGAYQKGAGRLRATARFVDVEKGEVLRAVKVDKKAGEVFELQDALAVEVRAVVKDVKARMRP